MDVRIEIRADRVDARDASLAQHVHQSAMNDFEPLPIRLGARCVNLQRAFEVVDDRQDVFHELDRGVLGRVFPLAIDSLPEIVKFGRLPKQTILELVAFLAQLDDLVGERR